MKNRKNHARAIFKKGGAGDGLVHNIMRNKVIERVDATLTGRRYDDNRAENTASRWPDDGVEGDIWSAHAEVMESDMAKQTMQQRDALIRERMNVR